MIKTVLFSFMLLATFTWSGCNKDNNTEPELKNDWVATYSVTETWVENNKTLSKPAFTMSIESSSIVEDLVLLNNFANYGAGVTVEGVVNGNNITISQQTLPNLKVIVGSGTILDDTLTLVYTERSGTVSTEVTAIAIKR